MGYFLLLGVQRCLPAFPSLLSLTRARSALSKTGTIAVPVGDSGSQTTTGPAPADTWVLNEVIIDPTGDNSSWAARYSAKGVDNAGRGGPIARHGMSIGKYPKESMIS